MVPNLFFNENGDVFVGNKSFWTFFTFRLFLKRKREKKNGGKMAVLRDGLIGWPFRLANVTVAPLKQTLPISNGSRGGWRSSWYFSALFLVLSHLNKNWAQLNMDPCLGSHGFQSNSPNCTWPGLGVKMAINSFGDTPTILHLCRNSFAHFYFPHFEIKMKSPQKRIHQFGNLGQENPFSEFSSSKGPIRT